MNATSRYEFTIVVPIYNEIDNMARIEAAFRDFLPRCMKRACVLFVDDGSTDGSLPAIADICSRNADFYYLSFTANRGLSAAIKAGIDTSESKWTGYIDADLQTTPEDFNLLLAEAEHYPLVTGIRANRKDTFGKRFQSKIANRFRRAMTGDTATDTGCPLKVLDTQYARRIPFFTGMHRFLPALVLLQDGGRFKEIPVRHFPREAGQSKFSLRNRLVAPFKDCFAYRWMKHRYINYTIGANNLS